MATVCQVYDETTSTILFDLNDPTGANTGDNGYTTTDLLQGVDLGSPSQEFTRFSPPQADGGSTVNTRAGFRTIKLPFRMRASSYDNLVGAMGKLTGYLAAGCVIRWQANTSANVRYIDVEPSPAPYVLDGRDLSMYLATTLVDTPEGLEIELTAQPYTRGSTLLDNSNLFTNATLLRDADGAGRPDGWAWSSTSNITNEAIVTTPAFQFDMAVSGANRSLTNSTAAATVAVGETWVVSGEARVTSGTMTNARAQAMLTWRTSVPADISTITSSLTTLTTAWQRVSISGVAPATTDRIQGGLRFNNTSATSATIQMRNIQVEEASAATPFHIGRESFTAEPAPTSGIGRLVPIWNPGTAPTPVTIAGTSSSSSAAIHIWGPMTDGAMVTLLNTPGANIQQIEDWTNGTDTTTSADANASGGSTKLTTFATATAMTTRATRTITTGMSTLQGRSWVALLRIGASTATWFGSVELWLDWGFGASDVITTAAIGTSGLASGSYVELPMGPFTFPDLPALNMGATVRASRTSGTGQLRWDCITWVPAEHLAYINADNQNMTNDPAANVAYKGAVIGSTSGRVTEVRGPIPYYAPPGLSLLYYAVGPDWNEAAGGDSVWGSFTNVLTQTITIRTQLTPRYYE